MAKKKSAKKSDSHEVKIPDAVKKQAEKADALLSGKEPESEDVIVDNPSEDSVVPPKEPEKPVFTPVEPEPPAPVKKDADPLPEDNVNWKHKYDVLQGMFNAKDGEVKALQQGMHNLQTLVDHQSEQINALSRQAPVAPETPATPATPAADIKKIDLDSVAGYGDEIVYMAEGFNALVEMNKSLMAQLGQKGQTQDNNPRLDRIETMVQETAQERYAKALDTEVPKWREVVDSPEFSGWLNTVDPMSGYSYKTLMDYAFNNLRAPQAAAIIKAFGNATNIDVGTPGSPAPRQRVGQTNIVDETQDPLAGQAMPTETTGGDQGQTPQNYPTAEDIQKAAADYSRKLISIEEFNDISDRFQQGLIAAKKAQGR